MAVTSITDLQVYLPYLKNYAKQYSTRTSALIKSGIAAPDPQIAELVRASGAAGRNVSLPFFTDLDGDGYADEGLAEGTDLTPMAIGSAQDVAAIHRRGAAFSSYDLAKAFTANDPVAAIGELIGGFRTRQRQKLLLSTLKGIFAANAAQNDGDLILDISSETGDAAVLNKNTLLYAAQLLGDAKKNLTAIVAHSQVELKLNTLSGDSQTYKPADERQGILASYNGKTLIMDDDMPFDPDTGIAEIYLFARGAVAMEDALSTEPSFETERKVLASASNLVERDFYILHPRGFKWVGTPAGATPTLQELETAANWSRVYEKKACRVCKLKCKLY